MASPTQVISPLTVSPIQSLPSELLSLILTYCLPPPTRVVSGSLRLPLLLVNRTWCLVANSTPQLWTFIRIWMEEPPFVTPAALSTWLDRSGSLPLDIEVVNDGDYPHDINDPLMFLVFHCLRWQSLVCRLHRPDAQRLLSAAARWGGLPLLERITLGCPPTTPTEFFGRGPFEPPSLSLSICPKLTSVYCESWAKLEIIPHEDAAPSTYALKSIAGYFSFSLGDCLHLIQNSPSLTKLSADCSDITSPFSTLDVRARVSNSSLTILHLVVSSEDQGANRFLDCVTLPSLKRLGLDVQPRDTIWSESLPNFLQRSVPPLQRFEIQGCDNDRLVNCLRHTPKLCDLASTLDATEDALNTLTCQEPSDSDPTATTTPDIAPEITRMSLKWVEGETTRENLTNMVLSRWGGPSGRFPAKGSLQSIRIESDQFSRREMSTPELDNCMREGLEVVWKCMPDLVVGSDSDSDGYGYGYGGGYGQQDSEDDSSDYAPEQDLGIDHNQEDQVDSDGDSWEGELVPGVWGAGDVGAGDDEYEEESDGFEGGRDGDGSEAGVEEGYGGERIHQFHLGGEVRWGQLSREGSEDDHGAQHDEDEPEGESGEDRYGVYEDGHEGDSEDGAFEGDLDDGGSEGEGGEDLGVEQDFDERPDVDSAEDASQEDLGDGGLEENGHGNVHSDDDPDYGGVQSGGYGGYPEEFGEPYEETRHYEDDQQYYEDSGPGETYNDAPFEDSGPEGDIPYYEPDEYDEPCADSGPDDGGWDDDDGGWSGGSDGGDCDYDSY